MFNCWLIIHFTKGLNEFINLFWNSGSPGGKGERGDKGERGLIGFMGDKGEIGTKWYHIHVQLLFYMALVWFYLNAFVLDSCHAQLVTNYKNNRQTLTV